VQTYTVHEPPNPPDSRVKRAERLVFVREGFTWRAALFAPFWMLAHRMWLVLLLYLVVVAAVDATLIATGFSSQWVALATIAVHVAVGFEAGTLRRWTLDRRRWRMLGAVTGQSETDCERRFFQAWLGEEREAPNAGSVRLSETVGQTTTQKLGLAPGPSAGPISSEA